VWDETFERLLRPRLSLLAPAAVIAADTPLALLGLDSLGTVALVAELEDAYAVSLSDDAMIPRNFRTARAFWSVLSVALEQSAGSSDD
jgi:acyl carrier protein